jgi:ubiquinone/menaquinone biosynthesis C-methylase UbiE
MIYLYLMFSVLTVAAIIWYLLITTEGAYLGRRAVIRLYDLFAKRYDDIKQFNPARDSKYLADPLYNALKDVKNPRVLDVATGTGRLPLALLREPRFHGRVIGLDASWGMVQVAAKKMTGKALWKSKEMGFAKISVNTISTLMQGDALHLPFANNSFDAVCCLEALEFIPDQDQVIRELIRVAKPGAVILLTNRIGDGARAMPGKTRPAAIMRQWLSDTHGLQEIQICRWWIEYDLVWSRKAGLPVLEE